MVFDNFLQHFPGKNRDETGDCMISINRLFNKGI